MTGEAAHRGCTGNKKHKRDCYSFSFTFSFINVFIFASHFHYLLPSVFFSLMLLDDSTLTLATNQASPCLHISTTPFKTQPLPLVKAHYGCDYSIYMTLRFNSPNKYIVWIKMHKFTTLKAYIWV